MVRDIRITEIGLGSEMLTIPESVNVARNKLERSIASKHFISKGNIITLDDIHLLSPGDGVKWVDKDMVVGKIAKVDIPKNEIIYKKDIG